MVTFPIYPHMSKVKPPIYSLYVHGYPLTPIHIMWAIRYCIECIPCALFLSELLPSCSLRNGALAAKVDASSNLYLLTMT